MKKFLGPNDGKVMLALAFVILVGAFLFAGGYFKLSYSPKDTTLYDNPIPKNFTSKNNLQLEYLKFGTESAGVTPRGSNPKIPACPKYTPLDPNDKTCECKEVVVCWYKTPKQVCSSTEGNNQGKETNSGQLCVPHQYCVLPKPLCENGALSLCFADDNNTSSGVSPNQCAKDMDDGLCTLQCIAKPVIYLYPTTPLFVDVKLEIPGRVTISDPQYPNDGWKNVYAYPNPLGAIKYEGKDYPYLYYETDVVKPEIPTQGFVVKTELLEPKLRDMLTKIGLIEHEQNDFIDYWLPELQAENKPYMFVTILPHQEKEKVDKVLMSIEPDTRIEVIFEFEPLDEFKIVTPLKLPATPPKREGFTMVEWGGAIN